MRRVVLPFSHSVTDESTFNLMAKYYTLIMIVVITVGLEDEESSVTILSWCNR